jgi:hypothetical protein
MRNACLGVLPSGLSLRVEDGVSNDLEQSRRGVGGKYKCVVILSTFAYLILRSASFLKVLLSESSLKSSVAH